MNEQLTPEQKRRIDEIDDLLVNLLEVAYGHNERLCATLNRARMPELAKDGRDGGIGLGHECSFGRVENRIADLQHVLGNISLQLNDLEQLI